MTDLLDWQCCYSPCQVDDRFVIRVHKPRLPCSKAACLPRLCVKALRANKGFVTNMDVSENEDPNLCDYQACLFHILTKSAGLK